MKNGQKQIKFIPIPIDRNNTRSNPIRVIRLLETSYCNICSIERTVAITILKVKYNYYKYFQTVNMKRWRGSLCLFVFGFWFVCMCVLVEFVLFVCFSRLGLCKFNIFIRNVLFIRKLLPILF